MAWSSERTWAERIGFQEMTQIRSDPKISRQKSLKMRPMDVAWFYRPFAIGVYGRGHTISFDSGMRGADQSCVGVANHQPPDTHPLRADASETMKDGSGVLYNSNRYWFVVIRVGVQMPAVLECSLKVVEVIERVETTTTVVGGRRMTRFGEEVFYWNWGPPREYPYDTAIDIDPNETTVIFSIPRSVP